MFIGRIGSRVDPVHLLGWGMSIALTGIAGIAIGSALGDVIGVVPLYTLSALLSATAGLIALLHLRSLVASRAAA